MLAQWPRTFSGIPHCKRWPVANLGGACMVGRDSSGCGESVNSTSSNADQLIKVALYPRPMAQRRTEPDSMRRVLLAAIAVITIAGSTGCCQMRCLCSFYSCNRKSHCVDCENPSWGYSPECRGPMCGAPDCFK